MVKFKTQLVLAAKLLITKGSIVTAPLVVVAYSFYLDNFAIPMNIRIHIYWGYIK